MKERFLSFRNRIENSLDKNLIKKDWFRSTYVVLFNVVGAGWGPLWTSTGLISYIVPTPWNFPFLLLSVVFVTLDIFKIGSNKLMPEVRHVKEPAEESA